MVLASVEAALGDCSRPAADGREFVAAAEGVLEGVDEVIEPGEG